MGAWPEPYIAGVSLTYDGSAPDQLTVVVPQLAEHDFNATFFAYPPELLVRIAQWRAVASSGHEIGNGFVAGLADSDGLLGDWPADVLEQDLAEAEELLTPIAGDLTSFCYPCVRTQWGKSGMPIVTEMVRSSIVKLNHELLSPIAKRYHFVRSPLDGFNLPPTCDFQNLHCFVADALDADSLSVLTHIGISQGAWVIIVFGGLRDHLVRAEEHRKYLSWLSHQRQVVKMGLCLKWGLCWVEQRTWRA